jgi:hypothetical protein
MTTSEDPLGKKVRSKGKTEMIVRVFDVIGFKDTQRVNVKWDDDTVSVNVRLSDLGILG